MEIMNAPVTHEVKYNPNIVDSYHYSNIHEANEQRRETTNQQRIDVFISYLAHYALVIVEGSSFLLCLLSFLLQLLQKGVVKSWVGPLSF